MFNSFWKYLGYEDYQVTTKTKVTNSVFSKKKSLLEEQNPTNFYYLSLIFEEDNKWSIHGLWPQYTLTKYPRFCKNQEFNINKLDPIMDRLKQDWYSNRGPDETFWEHEYLKHGTCNFNNLNEFNYFKTTLDLFDKSIALDLPEEFYNHETNKCLIPVNKEFNFFRISK